MSTTSKVVTVVGLIAGVVGASATADAKVLEHIVFHNNTAFVGFNSTTPLDCGGFESGIFTQVSLNGFEFTNRSTSNGDVRSNSASISLSQTNGCTGVSLFGFGTIDGGYTQDNLKSGHFVGTVSFFDFIGGGTITVAMDITITGDGPVTQQNQHFRNTTMTPSGPVIQSIHQSGKSVDADITAFALSVNGAPVPAPVQETVFSELAVSKSGTMQLIKSN